MKTLCTTALFFSLLVIASTAYGGDQLKFKAALSGAQEVVFDGGGNFVPGGVNTNATGHIVAKFDKALTEVAVNLRIKDLTGDFLAAHFHCGRPGQNGPVAFGLVSPGPLTFNGQRVKGTLTNTDFTGADCQPVIGRSVNNIAALAFAMRDGLIYINVHSSDFPPGEIRGQMIEDGHRSLFPFGFK